MNVTSPTCWQRFKACCCCCNKRKKLRPYRSPARLDEKVERSASSVIIHATAIEVKTHHALKSTDMVTALQCLQEDNERLRNEKANDRKDQADDKTIKT